MNSSQNNLTSIIGYLFTANPQDYIHMIEKKFTQLILVADIFLRVVKWCAGDCC